MLKSQPKVSLAPRHLELLEHFTTLFRRENIVNNSYLFKHMKSDLTLPVYILAEERKTAQITNDECLIVETLKMCELVRVTEDDRTIIIIDYPTIRIRFEHANDHNEIEQALRKQQRKFETYIYEEHSWTITIFDPNQQLVFETLASISKHFEKTHLYQDIRYGVQKLKKAKYQHANTQNYTRNKYMFDRYDRVPQIFIRKAVESDDQRQQKPITEKQQTNKESNQKKKKYKPAAKVILNMDDFPPLI